MKINFLGRYREVSQLLTGQSERTLGDLQPKSDAFNQVLEKTAEVAPAQTPAPKYRLRPLSLEGLLPEPSPQSVTIAPPPKVDSAPQGVKAPTLVDATWQEEPRPLERLPRAERKQEVARMLEQLGRHEGVDPALALGVVEAESGFNPQAVSEDGHYSKGLFQLLDSTGRQYLAELGEDGQYTPFDPDQNSRLGMRYLRRLHDIFSTNTELPRGLSSIKAANSSSLEKLAVAAFNAGEGRVSSAQQRALARGADPSIYEQVQGYLPKSTQEYVERVMRYRQTWPLAEGDFESEEARG
jgi:soluble lytic murein transglycosylase-like protein